MTPLTCSSCGLTGTYRFGMLDIMCTNPDCDHELMFSDLQLNDGEAATFNEDGVLCVYTPTLESEHDYGYYEEN